MVKVLRMSVLPLLQKWRVKTPWEALQVSRAGLCIQKHPLGGANQDSGLQAKLLQLWLWVWG